MDALGYIGVAALLALSWQGLKLLAAQNQPKTGYIRQKSPLDIRINIPISYQQLETFVTCLHEALRARQDVRFLVEGQTYELPYVALSHADWRYAFKADASAKTYCLDLSLKAGISLRSSKFKLTFESFKTLVSQLELALTNKMDFQCRLENQYIHIPSEALQQGLYRFEYEYEQKKSGKCQYELEFHLRSLP